MTRLAEVQSHIGSVGELLDIVGAMRSLAGMRIQEAQHSLPGIRRYADSLANAVGAALPLAPDPPSDARPAAGRRAFVLCTAEHGFVGGFNERLFDAAKPLLGRNDVLFVLGSRGAALAVERGWSPGWSSAMPTRSSSAPEAARHLAAELYHRIARAEVSRVEIMFSRYRQGSAPAVERHALLPLDFAHLEGKRPLQAPLHNLAPRALLERLVSQYVLALLTEAIVESITSENGARFATMQQAHENVSKKRDLLRREVQQIRQSEITTELLDIITGAEALNNRV